MISRGFGELPVSMHPQAGAWGRDKVAALSLALCMLDAEHNVLYNAGEFAWYEHSPLIDIGVIRMYIKNLYSIALAMTLVFPLCIHGATLKFLKLEIANTTLNRDHNSTLTLKAVYDDNTTKTPTNVEWLISPNDAVSIQGDTLTALKDTNVTIQAKVGNTLSNQVKLAIYWEVDGHRLPPEPDPKVNNATLLGVDVNHNGARDDVERWIYDKYKNKHPIYIDIAMQAARGYKLVLEHPERAKEIREKVNSAYFCGAYYQNDAKYVHERILINERIDSPVFGRYFNTKQRKDVYQQYDMLLSGDSYDIPWPDEQKALCDFNTSKYEE